MSKIICDICGTSYPESSKQCPICGSVRPGDAQRVTNEVKSDGNVSTGYTYVKGGRFSKSNVKKRAKTGDNSKKNVPQDRNEDDSKSNRGLVATAIVLLLAIIGVVIYIAVRFFAPISDPIPSNTENLGSDINLSCRDMTLDTYTVLLDQEGAAQLLNVKTTPEKPSEPLTFTSDNEAVAVVNDKGKITAVAEGTAKITVVCGNVTKECIVTVQFSNNETTDNTTGPEDTTAPSDTTTPEESTAPAEELRLNRKESFTLFYKGETWDLYTGSIPRNQITWSIGDASVATVDNGKVTAVGEGYTYVHAEYEGQKVSCQVICRWKNSSGIEGNGGVSEDGGGSGSSAFTGTIYKVNEFVNVRNAPNGQIVGKVMLGEKVTVTETKDAGGMTWGKIGTDKWVSIDYIKRG